jgi:hypothetical protein
MDVLLCVNIVMTMMRRTFDKLCKYRVAQKSVTFKYSFVLKGMFRFKPAS